MVKDVNVQKEEYYMSELFSFPKVTYVGNQSLTAGDGYHYYNDDERLKFSVAYWHTAHNGSTFDGSVW